MLQNSLGLLVEEPELNNSASETCDVFIVCAIHNSEGGWDESERYVMYLPLYYIKGAS